MSTEHLYFIPTTKVVKTEHTMLRCPSLPPATDWVVSVDAEGNPLSRFGDDLWDYRHYEMNAAFNFGKIKSSKENVAIAKLALFFMLHHPRLFPGKIRSCNYCFQCFAKIAEVCDKQGILIKDLPKFPRVYQLIADSLKCSLYKNYIAFLSKLNIYGKPFSLIFIDEKVIKFLATQIPKWEAIQTPYIPPRIWSYQIKRLNECIEDYLEHELKINEAFEWVMHAYEKNSISNGVPSGCQSPFAGLNSYKNKRVLYRGNFSDFLSDYGMEDIFLKWMGPSKSRSLSQFASFLNMVRDCCLLFIMNFSMQRSSEVLSLRSDCFIIEHDEKLGDIALITGETTKTIQDDDARWVVPKTIKKAVDVATSIAKLRVKCYEKFNSKSRLSIGSIPLALSSTEPWMNGKKNKLLEGRETISQLQCCNFINFYPYFIEESKVIVTESDWKIAVSLTPEIVKKKGFGVGLPWRFYCHQYRRTTNINMFSSSLVSNSSLQWEMKHAQLNMTLYYGRNHTNLRLNSDVETAVIIESYQSIYRNLVDVMQDSTEYIRPHKKEIIPESVVKLVEIGDEKKLINLIKEGKVGCRRTLLGYCMQSSYCKYGGIESVSKCAGGDGGNVCKDAIFERKNSDKLKKMKLAYERQMLLLDYNSNKYNALKQEVYAIGVYLDAIEN